MEGRTMSVKELYEEFPFPYQGNHDELVDKYVVPHVPFTPDSVLDAGCGTGNIAADLARRFSTARIVGIDFSEASLARARVLASERGLSNITLRQHDLSREFPHDLRERHRLILSIGVLHHTPDPALCLRNLRPLLADDGLFILAVYGKHGRIETELRRDLVNHLRETTGKNNRELLGIQRRVAAEPAFTQNLIRKMPPITAGLALDFAVRKARSLGGRLRPQPDVVLDVGEADQYLHPLVHNWTAKEWVTALDAAGFALDHFIYDPTPSGWLIPDRPLDTLENPAVRELFAGLAEVDRYEAFDLMFRPMLHFIACRPG
jgi:SAM-dependent methyltransferase